MPSTSLTNKIPRIRLDSSPYAKDMEDHLGGNDN